MKRTDARGNKPRPRGWKKQIYFAISCLAVIAVCLTLRQVWGPRPAAAQAPGVVGRAATAGSKPSGQKPAGQSANPLNVVASVNGEQISRQKLADESLLRYADEVLESIVNKHLIWQACQDEGINITQQDVEEEIGRLAAKFGLSPGRWLTLLQQEREIAPEQYRREIVWPTLALRQLAAQQLVVTPEEMNKAYEAEYGPRVKVRAITVTSRELAEKIHAMAVAKPESFGDLAKEHSEDQSASVHGLIPPIRKHVGNPQIEQAAYGMSEGEISPIVQIATQFIILKCEKQLPATYVAARFRKDAENRIRDRVQDQKMRTAASGLFQQLQRDAKVVNVYNDAERRKQFPGVAATINGQQISIQQLADECITRHGKDVLEGEINRKILTQALKRKNRTVEESDIDGEIARAADAYGFVKPDGSPDVEAWLEDTLKADGATVELYVRDAVWPTVALKQLVDSRVKVSEEDIQKGFVSNFGPRVEVLAIVQNNQRQAQKVWEMARDNPTDQFFGELAHQYSIDPASRENFGKVPPIRRHGGRPELEQEAFSLQPGELSGIIVSGENYVILRCQGQTTPVVQEMDDDVRNELVKDIREKKVRLAMSVEFDRLRESASIENYLAGSFQSGQTASEANRGGVPGVSARPRR